MAHETSTAQQRTHDDENSSAARTGIVDIEQLIPGYSPVSDLWQGAIPAFSSEYNARWFLRGHKQRLIQLRAIIFLAGRYYFHRERMTAALEQIGTEGAGHRAKRPGAAAVEPMLTR